MKLVFTREEEFVAIAQRREGIVMEFETGVMRDGRIVARKANSCWTRAPTAAREASSGRWPRCTRAVRT